MLLFESKYNNYIFNNEITILTIYSPKNNIKIDIKKKYNKEFIFELDNILANKLIEYVDICMEYGYTKKNKKQNLTSQINYKIDENENFIYIYKSILYPKYKIKNNTKLYKHYSEYVSVLNEFQRIYNKN